MRIARHIAAIPYSGIRKFFDVAAETEGVISLGVGEPDFYTPWNIREQAIYALEHSRTVYSSNAGLPALRKEIAAFLERKYDLRYDFKSQVLVTVGASEAIDLVLRAVIEPGDEVLVVEPCFVSYKPCVVMAGGTPVVITTRPENQFRVTPEEIQAKITPKTKALLMGYPNNPTGAVLRRGDLQKLAAFLAPRDIIVISDEIYSELTYSERHVSIAAMPGMADKTVVINGFSKAYAMTGWRLGYAAGPEDLIAAMTKIHQYVLMCASTTAQHAGIEALKNSDADVARMRGEYDARRRVMLEGFRAMGLPCFEPLGAFYLFPSIKAAGLSSDEFCIQLLRQEKLAVVPGTAFGQCGEGFVRCSYAYSIESLKEAMCRLGNFVKNM
jgi:aminotransferase